jgi:hypothetical protein
MAATIDAVDDGKQAVAFTSIMPILDDLLDLIGMQATSNEIGGGSNGELIKKVIPLEC